MKKICKCKHETQDILHGKQVRVWNKTLKLQGSKPVYRCTVCNKEQTGEEK